MKFQGEKLKKIRLAKGLSLEEIQKKTKINLNILKAIEGDSITNLEPIYIKGFLKIYCKFLGVDLRECVTDDKQIQETAQPLAPTKKEQPKPKEFKLPETSNPVLDYFKAHGKTIKAIFILILVIAVTSALLFNLGKFISLKRSYYLAKRKVAMDTIVKKKKIEQRQPQAKAPVAIPAPKPTVTTPLKQIASVIRLGIRTSENCWIQVKADGRLVFQRVLEKGRFESWQAKDRIELSLGNAGAVELEVNGQIFSNLGRRGEVRKNIIITREGLNIGR